MKAANPGCPDVKPVPDITYRVESTYFPEWPLVFFKCILLAPETQRKGPFRISCLWANFPVSEVVTKRGSLPNT